MPPSASSWRPDGIVISPIEGQTTPLQDGDILVAIDGRSLESWARALPRLDLPRPRWDVGQTLIYTLMRNGQRVNVPVVLVPYPLASILLAHWAVFVTAVLFLGVMGFLYLKRPREPVTRVFLWAAAALSGSPIPWTLGLQASDFVGGVGVWLHQISTLPIYLLIWVAFLHVVLVFPEPHPSVVRRRWLLPLIYAAPYAVYAAYLPLAAAVSTSTLDWLGRVNQFAIVNPTSYVGLAAVLAVRRYRQLKDPIHRLQVRWLFFSFVVLSVAALGLGFIPELLSVPSLVSWDVISLLSLVVPLALGIAVLRYRLFDIDVIINRTLVYVPLTAILAGVYAASIKLFQVFFVAATGNESDGAIILTTLILASAFTPVKNGLQTRVDRTFAQPFEPARRLRAFDQQVQQLIEALDTRQSIRRLLDLAVEAYGARGGAVYLARNGRQSVVYQTTDWKGVEARRVTLEWEGSRVGMLKLGPPRPGPAHPPLDSAVLEGCAERVAHLSQLLQAPRAVRNQRRIPRSARSGHSH